MSAVCTIPSVSATAKSPWWQVFAVEEGHVPVMFVEFMVEWRVESSWEGRVCFGLALMIQDSAMRRM